MKILTITSQKGGVGKTTVSLNTAYAIARSGKKVLLVDLDPQGSVGLSLTKKSNRLTGFFDYLEDSELKAEDTITHTKLPTMHIVTAGKDSYLGLSATIDADKLERLETFFKEVKELDYDLCIVDTASGLFGFAGEILNMSDAVFVPQQCQPLGIRSVPKLFQALVAIKEKNPKLHILGILLTMVQEDLEESQESAEGLRAVLPAEFIFNTQIPRDDMFIKASAKGLPVSLVPGSAGISQVFENLREEIEEKFNF